MASKTIRRRLYHDDIHDNKDNTGETTDPDALTEPLLGSCNRDVSQSEMPDVKDKGKKPLHWTHLLSCSISRWARRIAGVFISFGSFLKNLFHHSFVKTILDGDKKILTNLSPLQEERLRNLRHRLGVPFDGSCLDHQDALKELWRLAYPNRQLPALKSDIWKEMGWQGSDPSTDFRGGGFISLENLIYFAKNYPDSFQRLLHKQDGKRSEWEYPFAAAGINVSYMLTQMLDLQSGQRISRARSQFMKLLEGDEMAFDELYCVAFQMLDAQWLEKGATYMEFNGILKSTRSELEKELAMQGICSIQDMPAYKMLSR